ncbi:GAF domain-containing sensor histidine kinase [Leptolyngbya sp. NK1-12]|uniref:histidine kinase n=1 Tax=Leptolyngbya sp. NK1-12 TaxID=2547451 RepID=A0AA96WBZ7_9CYAN|nr:GAF domain-containing sensor histidine kinase [Leptolyngbya sp. NK1-12]WNZ22418.1 GAF domain-containing sensor histidine kinase [Leptolyngbya sp. NK1-12]
MSLAIYLNILDEVLRQFKYSQDELQRTYGFGNRLQSIADKVRDSLDEAQILQTAVQELAIGLGVDSCDTGIYDLQHGTSTVAYEYVAGQVLPVQGLVVSMLDYPEVYSQLLQGQYVHGCWYPLDQKIHNVRRISGHFAALVHPIIDNQQVIGDLWLYRVGAEGFEPEEIWLVQQVATQCAIAIRQARLYQAAQAQVTELARLNRLKDDFLTTVSHELRTPIATIATAVQMLELELQRIGVELAANPGLQFYLTVLQQESQQEIILIDNLLALTRIESETEPLVLTTIDPHIWVADVLEPFADYANSQKQQLELDIPIDLPPLTTDVADLERILTELLTNACKYTLAGGTITVSAALWNPSPPNSAPMLDLTICNPGISLSADECERIFDQFYRFPSSAPGKQQGIGLGLALVKKLTTRIGATIEAKSSADHLVFRLRLPLTASN